MRELGAISLFLLAMLVTAAGAFVALSLPSPSPLAPGQSVKISPSQWSSIDPAPSPDGALVAFSSPGTDPSGLFGIWLMTPKGDDFRRVTPPEVGNATSPQWSFNGQLIAFKLSRGNQTSIATTDRLGTFLSAVPGSEGARSLSWSRQREWLVFDSVGDASGVFLFDFRLNSTRRLATGDCRSPTLLFDDSAVVYARFASSNQSVIESTDVSTGVALVVANPPGVNIWPKASPTRRAVAWLSESGGAWGIWTVGLDSGTLSNLFSVPPVQSWLTGLSLAADSDSAPVWSPSGSSVAFTHISLIGEVSLYSIDLNITFFQQQPGASYRSHSIPKGLALSASQHSLQGPVYGFSFMPDGRSWVYCGQASGTPVVFSLRFGAAQSPYG